MDIGQYVKMDDGSVWCYNKKTGEIFKVTLEEKGAEEFISAFWIELIQTLNQRAEEKTV